MTKRLAFVFATTFCFLVAVSWRAPVSAKDSWTSVRSKNFLLVGNASEKEIRQVGVRLEQFREVFAHLFTNMNVNSPVPTTVIVFKNEASYRPFKPNANSAGCFQPGPDVNYITLNIETDPQNEQDAFNIIFHEYTHLLVKNSRGNVPIWFNEGLAEYYSTFSITDDQKVIMGRPIASHVYLLRENKMLPLRTLFQVDQKSPYYNERDKQSIFYAESWALMHYLILGKEGQRAKQMGKFVDLLTAGVPMEQAFQQTFAMTFEDMERELRAYVQRDRYPILSGSFTNKVAFDAATESAPLTEAEVQAYLGDLLLHSNRAESETYLLKALALNPDLALANASLGMLRVRQGRSADARKSLERAVAASSQNYLIHYYYAYALSREVSRDMQSVMGLPPETATRMRSELKRAIELRPDFPESYSLLAFVNLVTETDLDETIELLKHTLVVTPDRSDLVFMLAQIYMRKEDFKTARQLIDKLSGDNDPEMRERAHSLLAQLVANEAQLARIRAIKEQEAADSRDRPVRQVSSNASGQADAVENYDPAAALRESLKKPNAGETQTQGTLVRIDCDAKGVYFVVRTNERLLKLSTDSFRHMDLMTFTENAGKEVTCGLRKPEDNVVVCYLPVKDVRGRTDGTIKSVEFVPPDFKLRASP